MHRSTPVLFITLALATAGAQAQSNLGELLDLGARKLSAAEVQALGDVRLLRQATDADAYITLRADGSVVGMVHNKQGQGSSEAVGRWQVDAAGRRCLDVQLPAFSMSMKQCGYTFALGRDAWFVPSDENRAAGVTLHAHNAFLRN